MNAYGHLFNMYEVYEQITLILGIQNLMMGTTLLLLHRSLKNSGTRSKSGLFFLALAMFVLCVVNLAEYFWGMDGRKECDTLAVMVFAASMELFLLLFAYMSMISKGFVSKKRICAEIGLIAVFTTPTLLISSTDHPLLFRVLFTIGILFYGVKLAYSLFVYKRRMKRTKEENANFLSDDSSLWLKWIDNTFYIVLAIGAISVIVPMTNLTVLVLYNVFLFFSYLYIYISVLLNITIFDKSMTMLDKDESLLESEETESLEVECLPVDARPISPSGFMVGREKFLNDWIADKGYAVAGVTATEVALRLNTNRTRLSQYLKNELHTNYYEWIATLRIEDAKRQLKEYPERSVYEIALNVGIEDRDNFRRAFQRYVGMSPTTYRKMALEKLT